MKFLISFLLFVGLTGCAQMQKDWEARTCNYDGSYAEGVNDAQNRSKMNPARLTSQCPSNTLAEVQKGYREGYTTQNNSLSGLVDRLRPQSASACVSKDSDAHSSFCGGFGQSECQTHSGVCSWR